MLWLPFRTCLATIVARSCARVCRSPVPFPSRYASPRPRREPARRICASLTEGIMSGISGVLRPLRRQHPRPVRLPYHQETVREIRNIRGIRSEGVFRKLRGFRRSLRKRSRGPSGCSTPSQDARSGSSPTMNSGAGEGFSRITRISRTVPGSARKAEDRPARIHLLGSRAGILLQPGCPGGGCWADGLAPDSSG